MIVTGRMYAVVCGKRSGRSPTLPGSPKPTVSSDGRFAVLSAIKPHVQHHARPISLPTRQGSVLVLALWMLVFLTTLALAVNARVNGMMHFARVLRSERIAYEAARAGADRAMAVVLAAADDGDGWLDDEDRFRDVPLGQGRFSVTYTRYRVDGSMLTGYGVIGEETRVNVNRAAPALLTALFQGAGGLDGRSAQTLADRIVATRTEDDSALTDLSGRRYGPRLAEGQMRPSGPFESMHELLLIDGMARDVFERLQPYMTLYGSGRINLNGAAPAVLLALAESTGAGDAALRVSLTQKLAHYREAGLVFTAASETAIVKDLEKVAAVSPQERQVLRAMLGGATLQSSFFGGVAEGWATRAETVGTDGAQQAARRIAFVVDRQGMARVDWREF